VNSPSYGSALSYIPEIPWDDTCASELTAIWFFGSNKTYGADGSCNKLGHAYLSNTGGSGGPSACATGKPAVFGVVGGTCQGWPKPSWQSGFLGNSADGVRDIPDVSLSLATRRGKPALRPPPAPAASSSAPAPTTLSI
jgi:hypothetical protein